MNSFCSFQYVVIPTRRATAEAIQILLSHALGDAGSPYLIGQVSEILKGVLGPKPNGTDTAVLLAEPTAAPQPFNCNGSSINPDTAEVDFTALQYSLLITVVVEVIGGFFFLATAWYIVEDKAKVDRAVAGECQSHLSSLSFH
jgi:MFS transporter, Spinster family, sphingosine-1-phosphate transporter